MKLWDSVTAWSISAGAAPDLFWSYQGYSIAYVYENYAIQEHTFDHEVVMNICMYLCVKLRQIGGLDENPAVAPILIFLLEQYGS